MLIRDTQMGSVPTQTPFVTHGNLRPLAETEWHYEYWTVASKVGKPIIFTQIFTLMALLDDFCSIFLFLCSHYATTCLCLLSRVLGILFLIKECLEISWRVYQIGHSLFMKSLPYTPADPCIKNWSEVVKEKTASCALRLFRFPSYPLLSKAHSILPSLLLLSLPDCQGQLKKNQIDSWLGAVTHIRLSAPAEPWVLLSKSFPVSQAALFLICHAFRICMCSSLLEEPFWKVSL